MAGAAAASVAILRPFKSFCPTPRRKPIQLISSASPQFPRKLTKRNNHLRQKILTKPSQPTFPIPESPSTRLRRTLTKPSEPILPIPELPSTKPASSESAVTIQRPRIAFYEDLKFCLALHLVAVVLTVNAVRKRFGRWLLGVLSLGTIYTVWKKYGLWSVDFDDKDENLDDGSDSGVPQLGENKSDQLKMPYSVEGNRNGKLGHENGGYEVEAERKIEEIRLMARGAREMERMGSERDGFGDGSEGTGVSGIGKEVEDRLVKLRKRLQKAPVSPPGYSHTGGEGRYGVDKDSLDVKERNGALLFKKKHKFRGFSSESIEKPKGFVAMPHQNDGKEEEMRSTEQGVELSKGGNYSKLKISDREQELDIPVHHIEEYMSTNPRGNKKSEAMGAVADSVRDAGIAPDNNNVTPDETVKPRELGILEPSSLPKKDVLVKEKKGPEREEVDKKSNNKTKFWWSSLPFVLVVLMNRGHDSEGSQGLFTIKSTSDDDADSSYTVAFEDCNDATNFCYILQSFFEELGDFSANAIPLAIKELLGAVSSLSMKVIVVKKGQLKLYAGQPLVDVEMTLRTLVGQS